MGIKIKKSILTFLKIKKDKTRNINNESSAPPYCEKNFLIEMNSTQKQTYCLEGR